MNRIPNHFHFIFGLKPQEEPFHLAYYLCLESCFQINKPEKISFYYHHEPYGIYWEDIKDRLEIIQIDSSPFVKNIRYKDTFIEKFSYAHYTDFLRLEKIIEHGGVYADIDTLFVQKIPEELFTHEFVIGKEHDVEDPQTGEISSSLSNAFFLAQKESLFAKKWLDEMYSVFDGSWSKHSCQLAYTLSRLYPENIHIEPQRSFSPYNHTREGINALFRKTEKNLDEIYSIHLLEHLWWSRFRRDFSRFHSGYITKKHITKTNSTYNVVARKFLPAISLKRKTTYLLTHLPRHLKGFLKRNLQAVWYSSNRVYIKLRSCIVKKDNCYTLDTTSHSSNAEDSSDKPLMLFLSPIVPSRHRNGLAMRAYQVISELKKSYRIHLVVIAHNLRKNKTPTKPHPDLYTTYTYINSAYLAPFSFLLKKFLYHVIVPTPAEWLMRSGSWCKHISKQLANTHIDVIHLFRLYMYPIAQEIHKQHPGSFLNIDLDDIESDCRKKIAELHKRNKNYTYRKEEKKAVFYQKKEQELLNIFHTIYVCSEYDKSQLEKKYAIKKCAVLPNKIIIPKTSRNKDTSKNGYSLLFIGALNYYPNAEGIIFFCNEILPVLRSKTNKEITVTIIGQGLKNSYRKKMEMIKEVTIAGYVDNVEPYYQNADIVIVPLRAGGGTRIKILEAFSYHTPVVSTSIGAEGLDVEDKKHILLANMTEDFADNCLLLLENKELKNTLTSQAFSLVKQKYSYSPL